MKIPVLNVTGKSPAEAFERALVSLWENGIKIKTQYDGDNLPPSLDCSMNMTIEEPLSDPMIHKAFPGGIADLREYVLELQGMKDSWVKDMNNPEDTRWEYTYHGRLKKYGRWMEAVDEKSTIAGPFEVDQIEAIIQKLISQPYTRQAQMITWMPNIDNTCFDPPCLQSLWYRILEDEDGVWWLNCNVRFRSNDAWGACMMNIFGLIMFNKEIIADEISKRTGRTVNLSRMNWQADSFHVYGKDIEMAKKLLFDKVSKTTFGERVYNFYDQDIQEMYAEETLSIIQKISSYAR